MENDAVRNGATKHVGAERQSAPLVSNQAGATPDLPGHTISSLATMPANTVLDITALAAAIGRSKKSVQRAVRRGELPQPFKFLGKSQWLAGAIVQHFQAQQTAALQEAERHAKKLLQHRI